MNAHSRRATIYRMVMPDHICPFGLKSLDLLKREGFSVDDNWLKTREETDSFKAEHEVETTPQTFIDGQRVGGYDDLLRHFGKTVRDPKAVTYQPVIAVFAMAALMALAASWAAFSDVLTARALEMVYRDFHVYTCDPEASGRRELLQHVPRLRPAGPALGPLCLPLSIRGSALPGS